MTGTAVITLETAKLRREAQKVKNTKQAAYVAALARLDAAVEHDEEVARLRYERKRTGDTTLLTHEQNEASREARDKANREAFEALQALNISIAEWHIADRNHLQARTDAAQDAADWVNFHKLQSRTRSADTKAVKAIKKACGYWSGAARLAIYEPLFAQLRPNCKR